MKFELNIDMDNKTFKSEPLSKIVQILADISERVDAQWLAGGAGEGIIWDDDNNSIGSFGIV